MIDWLLNWLKVTVARWLLADELEAERVRDREKWRRQQEIIDANYETSDTARDLDSGEF